MQILTVAAPERLRRFAPRMKSARVTVTTARSAGDVTRRFRGRGRRPDLVVVDSKLGADVLPGIAAGAGGTAILFQDLEHVTSATVAAFASPAAAPADSGRRRGAPSHALEELHDPESGRLDAVRVARFLGLSLSALAKALERSPQTLHKTPDAPRLQGALAPLARIAASLVTLFGSAEKARVWMNAPNAELDGVAPLEVVKANKAGVVADLLEDALLGHPA
jgi:uncharacterized protein (DUF2384 family)